MMRAWAMIAKKTRTMPMAIQMDDRLEEDDRMELESVRSDQKT